MLMATVIPAGFANCSLGIRLAGDPEDMAITFGIGLTDPAAQPTQAQVQTLFTNLANTLDQDTPSHFSYVNGRMTVGPNIHAGGANPGTLYEVPLAVPGTVTATTVPQNSALLVRKNTALAGRKGKGRLYLPFVFEIGVNNIGQLDASNVAATNTYMAAFLAACNAAPFSGMVLLHNKIVGPGAPPVQVIPDPTPVTSLVCQPVIATQRRRLRK
jgi:hypothetical protein